MEFHVVERKSADFSKDDAVVADRDSCVQYLWFGFLAPSFTALNL